MTTYYLRYQGAIASITRSFLTHSRTIHTEKWQGVDISKKPEMATHELLNVSFGVESYTENLETLRADIQPNLPWADDHFIERVCGEPLNPGVQWAKWPWGNSADKFREAHGGQFNHNYMERYWPKYAGQTVGGGLDPLLHLDAHHGIRYEYGDLDDVVRLLFAQPFTRQAYLPVWFPEDTGVCHGDRAPCTLGYHFIMRDDLLHVVYFIRSCDFVRHFRDDIYLTARLQLWVLNRLREMNPDLWKKVLPGRFTMHITSLHFFRNDWRQLFGEARPPA